MSVGDLGHAAGSGHGVHSRPSSSLLWKRVDWFNNQRVLEPIGNIPPDEAEERHYATLEQSAMAG